MQREYKVGPDIRWLRPHDAAQYIGLAVSTLAKLRVTGEGPTYSVLGRAISYDIADLDEWVCQRKRSSTSEMEGRCE